MTEKGGRSSKKLLMDLMKDLRSPENLSGEIESSWQAEAAVRATFCSK
jgi:hypothetical protein